MKKRLSCILSLILCCMLLTNSVVSAATVKICVAKVSSSGYVTAASYKLSAGSTFSISWKGDGKYFCYLYNMTTGNYTDTKSSTSKITFTSLRAGKYIVRVLKGSGTLYDKVFTVSIT